MKCEQCGTTEDVQMTCTTIYWAGTAIADLVRFDLCRPCAETMATYLRQRALAWKAAFAPPTTAKEGT